MIEKGSFGEGAVGVEDCFFEESYCLFGIVIFGGYSC